MGYKVLELTKLTPQLEKHNTVRPSGAHSALTRPDPIQG